MQVGVGDRVDGRTDIQWCARCKIHPVHRGIAKSRNPGISAIERGKSIRRHIAVTQSTIAAPQLQQVDYRLKGLEERLFTDIPSSRGCRERAPLLIGSEYRKVGVL